MGLDHYAESGSRLQAFVAAPNEAKFWPVPQLSRTFPFVGDTTDKHQVGMLRHLVCGYPPLSILTARQSVVRMEISRLC